MDQVEAKITSRTKAILVVHIYGHPADMDRILDIARRHDLYVVEDAAEAHGAAYHGRSVGSLGDVACFSFYANKIITTGEGGMLTTNNREIAETARRLSLPRERPGVRSVFWMYGLLVENEFGCSHDPNRYPVADALCRKGMYLPSSAVLTEAEIRYVAEAVSAARGRRA